MGSNLLFGLAIYLLIFVSAVISGRFPLGKDRMSIDGDSYDDIDDVVGPANMRMLDWGGDEDVDENEDKTLELSREDLESYLNGGDEENTAYITDVQINELQNAQDKVQDQQAYQVDPRCPKLDGMCSARVCTSDNDCGDKICCYNGCVHTCLGREPLPIEIDWIPYGSEDNERLLSRNDTGTETITIPGGCKVSRMQKHSLDLFFKYGHVTDCVCMKDDVVCYVRKRDTFTASNFEIQRTE